MSLKAQCSCLLPRCVHTLCSEVVPAADSIAVTALKLQSHVIRSDEQLVVFTCIRSGTQRKPYARRVDQRSFTSA
jgi:hypothetical protein